MKIEVNKRLFSYANKDKTLWVGILTIKLPKNNYGILIPELRGKIINLDNFILPFYVKVRATELEVEFIMDDYEELEKAIKVTIEQLVKTLRQIKENSKKHKKEFMIKKSEEKQVIEI